MRNLLMRANTQKFYVLRNKLMRVGPFLKILRNWLCETAFQTIFFRFNKQNELKNFQRNTNKMCKNVLFISIVFILVIVIDNLKYVSNFFSILLPIILWITFIFHSCHKKLNVICVCLRFFVNMGIQMLMPGA